MLALSIQCSGFSNRLHLCPGLNAPAKICKQIVFATLAKKKKHLKDTAVRNVEKK